MNIVEIKILNQAICTELPLLQLGTPGSAGYDLSACIDHPVSIEPGIAMLIPTGLAIHIQDQNYVGLIFPRSGLGHKYGLILGNGTGVIDADYQGPLMVSCFNRSQKTYTIQHGDRIAQLVIVPVAHPTFRVVTEFSNKTERGQGGFGSTDHAP